MRTVTVILLVSLLFAGSVHAQTISNDEYVVSAAKDFREHPSFLITHKQSKIQRRLLPVVKLVFTGEQPALTGALMDGQPGVVAWKTSKGTTTDINALGSTELTAYSCQASNKQLVFQFKDHPAAKVSLTIKFNSEHTAPVIEMGFEAHRSGNYSIGFNGMPEVDSAEVDFVYQPLTWTWKRFPSNFALTEEAFANTAAVFTNHNGYTEGLAVSLADIPYRYALAAQWNNAGKPDNKFWSVFPADGPKGNSMFGLALRNAAGKAQPVVYAPLPGNASARMVKGKSRKLGLVYILHPGDWQEGTTYLLSKIFNYRSERQNAGVSLNQTFENMLAFAMDDKYGGWNDTLKASNYDFDVPGTVKNVSALHPLSIYLATGNEDILKRRALPMIEYVMSREKFLYSKTDIPGQSQQPSHFLKGPAVDIGELTALNELTNGATPAFALEAARLFGKSRKLNMNTETGGGSWQDYLARYRLSHNEADLKKSMQGADEYLKQVLDQYSHNFFDSPGLRDRGAGFTTDYGFRIYDLFELFLETKNEKYLKAALTGAKQFLLWTRSNPAPPAGNIKVNKGGEVKGIFPGRRVSPMEASPFEPMNETTQVPETTVPAWQTSLNGLIPEAPNTYTFGPVMLAHHAAWLLRLAHYANDTLLRNAAYNAVIGRYQNFPGYYFTSLHTDIYQRADYPMHPFNDIKYNAIFYNHVWPHLALLMDFMVSDFYYRSKGKVDYPGTFAPGYAFLTSNVYGAKKGTVMGHTNVQLWMPSGAVRSNGIAFNYLMGHDETDVFISFSNTSRESKTEQLQLNKELVKWKPGVSYEVVVYGNNGDSSRALMKDGQLTVTLAAGDINTLQIKKLYAPVADSRFDKPAAQSGNRFVRYTATEDSLATATAMIIQPNAKMAVCYVFSDQTEKQWKQSTLRYRLNNEEKWTSVLDTSYPFEWTVPLAATTDAVSFELSGTRQDGSSVHFPTRTLNDGSSTVRRNGGITILGFGDSITEGGPNFSSYLFPLDSLLKVAGYRVSFIGPRKSGQGGDTLSHAGFSGRNAEFLVARADSIYSLYPADVVLLHAGHNHFVEENPVAGIVEAQKRIISIIHGRNPSARILVAGVITAGKLPKYDYIPELNAALKTMVGSLQDTAVKFVDQQKGWDWSVNTIDDKVHPNKMGAGIIASKWFDAIRQLGIVQKDSLVPAKEVTARGGLPNFSRKVAEGKTVRISFLGGSITRAGNGYRSQILEKLRQEYPNTTFEEIMAAVSGTGSDYGACRVKQHVIDLKPDLLFCEFAVNDNRWPMKYVRETMEGIVRQVWKASATTDICFVYTFANENLVDLRRGVFPASASAMEAVADHYQIPSIHMGLAAIEEINSGKMLMMGKSDGSQQLPLFSNDGVHPLPETGHKIYTAVLAKNLDLMKSNPGIVRHKLPAPLEPDNWSDAGMADLSMKRNFTGTWAITDSVTKGKEYYSLMPEVFSTVSPDAVATIKFKCTRFGLADIMGPTTSVIEVRIDNDPPRIINRFDAFSTYYRLNYFLIKNLSPGSHTATIRLSSSPLDKEAILKTRTQTISNPLLYRQNALYVGAILH